MSQSSTLYPQPKADAGVAAPGVRATHVRDPERECAQAEARLAAGVQERDDLERQRIAAQEENVARRRILHHNPTVSFSWRVRGSWPVDFVSDNVIRFGYAPEDFDSGPLLYRIPGRCPLIWTFPLDIERKNADPVYQRVDETRI
jgi:hypothetical protein